VIANLSLIDTKHQGIENSWRQIIVVYLIAFVRRLRLLTTRVIEDKEEPIGLGRDALIKEGAWFEGVFFASLNTNVRMSCCSALPYIYLALIAISTVSHQTIGILPLLYQLRYILKRAGNSLSARNPSILLQVLLNIGEILTAIFNQTASEIMVPFTIAWKSHLLTLI